MLPHIVAEAADRFGERAVLVDHRGLELTYAELHRRSDRAASAFADAGLGIGSVVALAIGSTFDYVVAYVAAAKIGAITAGINPSLAAAEQSALIERLGPDLVIDGPVPERPGTVAALPDDPERIVAVVFTSGTTGPPKGAVFRNRQLAAICEADLGREAGTVGWRRSDRWRPPSSRTSGS